MPVLYMTPRRFTLRMLSDPLPGRYQAAQIPHCYARLLPGEGHLLVIDHMPELIDAFRG